MSTIPIAHYQETQDELDQSFLVSSTNHTNHRRNGHNTDSSQSNSFIQSIIHSSITLKLLLLVSLIAFTELIVILVIALSSSSSSSNNANPLNPSVSCKFPSASGTQGMVSTTHYLATQAGVSILEAGGNAFDAAAAVQFVLNVVQPQSTGIGGGCFANFYVRNDNRWGDHYYTLDAREEAPAQFEGTSFCYNSSKCFTSSDAFEFRYRTSGGRPNGVPGVVAAMDRLLSDWGTMSLSQVLQPAIQLAENGFPMYQEMYSRLMLNWDRMQYYDASVKLFFPNLSIPTQPTPIWPGQTFKNPDLAQTFKDLAANGANWFYTGSLAQDIISASEQAIHPITLAGGLLSSSDFSSYRAVYREPITSIYRGTTVIGMGPPSSGGLSLAMMLNTLEQYDLPGIVPGSAEWNHRLIDSQDIVFADRDFYMGDIDFLDNFPIKQLQDKQYSYARARNLTSNFQSAKSLNGGNSLKYGILPPDPSFNNPTPNERDSMVHHYAIAPPNIKKGTTHMVVIDKWNNIVSLTTTIEENFGSGVVVPGRGFLLNNELTDFTPTPVNLTGFPYANAPTGERRPRRSALYEDKNTVGGKRPMSSMTPTLLVNTSTQRPFAAFGSPGGSYIIGTVLNGVVNLLDGKMCLSDAIAAARTISQNLQNGNPQSEFPWFTPDHEYDRKILIQRQFNITILTTDRPLGYIEGGFIVNDNQFIGAADNTRLPVASAAGY